MKTCASKNGVACNGDLQSVTPVLTDDDIHQAVNEWCEGGKSKPLQIKENVVEENVVLQLIKEKTAELRRDFEESESDLKSSDVELIMSQASCPRHVAVRALRENDNDIVNAILDAMTIEKW